MDLQTRKIEFIQEFLKIQSEDIILRFEKMLKKEKTKVNASQTDTLSCQELNKRIDRSMKDSKNGKLTENKELLQEIKKWH